MTAWALALSFQVRASHNSLAAVSSCSIVFEGKTWYLSFLTTEGLDIVSEKRSYLISQQGSRTQILCQGSSERARLIKSK